MTSLRIAVVGPCASGKSTLVARLRAKGYDAFAVAQEHSIIPELWRHRTPDVVVLLDVSLDTIRARREKPDWPEWLYIKQEQRLADARSHADLVIDANHPTPVEIEERVERWLEDRQRS